MNRSPKLHSCIAGIACLVLCCACSEASDDAFDGERWRDVKQEIRERFDDVRQVTIEEFERTRGPDALLVDVRAPEEYAVSRIEGARSVPLEDGVVEALADQPRDRPIIVYCSVGWRSSVAAQELQRAGFTDVTNLEGSIFEWANSGRPVVDDAGPAEVVHPYDRSWSRLLRPELRGR